MMAYRKTFRGKKVFITGATSFIGSHLVRRLVSEGACVHLFVRSPKNFYRLRDVLSQVECHKGDIRDRATLIKLMKQVNPQVIFHLACFGVRPGQSDLLKLVEVNIQGLVNVLSCLKERNFECFVYSGTSAEYGPSGMPMSENQLLNPVTPYGATKAAGTLLTQAFGRVHRKKVLILRPFYVYGPDEGPSRFVSTVIRAGLCGRQLKLTALSEKRDFIYVEDVIDAYILSVTKNIETNTVLNIGTGKESSLKDAIGEVEKKIGKKIKVKEGAYSSRPWKSRCWAADISKAQEVLGWKPTHTLSAGIDKTIAWIKSSPNKI